MRRGDVAASGRERDEKLIASIRLQSVELMHIGLKSILKIIYFSICKFILHFSCKIFAYIKKKLYLCT